MAAMSGDKTKDYKQGMVEGLLKAAGYNEDMVFKFWTFYCFFGFLVFILVTEPPISFAPYFSSFIVSSHRFKFRFDT